MKIRINGNTIRMRLSPNEVRELVKSGSVTDTCAFPTGNFTYGIRSTQATEIDATFVDGYIAVLVPEKLLIDWDINEVVGFEHTTKTGTFMLIEKDFKCLQPRKHENESHLYENPIVSK